MKIDNHEDLPEYAVAKKVWDDIFNNDTLIYDKFDEYFFDQFYIRKDKSFLEEVRDVTNELFPRNDND